MKSNKSKTQERIINELKNELEKLKRENAYLKQLVPIGDNSRSVEGLMQQYQKAISEANDIRDKYTAAVQEMKMMKKSYKKEMDKLMSRIRKGK
ncbi:MAG: hypothetical protein J1E56_02740 [Ruminococcus sp.]|nr:hypothetical protein [Ruminococcus sp.]